MMLKRLKNHRCSKDLKVRGIFYSLQFLRIIKYAWKIPDSKIDVGCYTDSDSLNKSV